MIYPYHCPTCDKFCHVIKTSDEFDRPEYCECSAQLVRIFTAPQLMAIKPEDAYKSLALGKVVSSSKEERKLAKAMGYEEVGNEIQSKHIKKEFKPYPTLGELGIC